MCSSQPKMTCKLQNLISVNSSTLVSEPPTWRQVSGFCPKERTPTTSTRRRTRPRCRWRPRLVRCVRSSFCWSTALTRGPRTWRGRRRENTPRWRASTVYQQGYKQQSTNCPIDSASSCAGGDLTMLTNIT